MSQKPARRCQLCGTPEKRYKFGYTTIPTFLGVCVDCLTREVKAAQKIERRQRHEEIQEATQRAIRAASPHRRNEVTT